MSDRNMDFIHESTLTVHCRREMNTFNSQKCRNRNRQKERYIDYTITLSELITLIQQCLLYQYHKIIINP